MKTADAELCHTVLFYSAGPPVSLANPLSQAPQRHWRLQGCACLPACLPVRGCFFFFFEVQIRREAEGEEALMAVAVTHAPRG